MKTLSTILALLLLVAAPITGAYLAGYDIVDYLDFPPRNVMLQPDHAPFSTTVYILLILAILIVVLPFVIKVIASEKTTNTYVKNKKGFPAWGWVGAGITIAGWILAWSRFDWFADWQTHTFTPLWFGYVIVINALTYMRSGRSLISHSPVLIAVLFVCSAFFWWYFEYLNLFIENWYYVNVEELGSRTYFWRATLPFATVLPAVMSTKEFLQTFPSFSAGLGHYFKLPVPHHRFLAAPLMIIAAVSLALTAVWTDYLFYMVWLAPLVIMTSAMVMARKTTIFSGIAHGQWKELYHWGMAALFCGFFWEMWNHFSYTQWEYAIPYAERFYLFKMPLPGYAGYLPFGLQCGIICALIQDLLPKRLRD